MLNVFRSSAAAFDHDADRADSVYTDDELRRIADAGFNAVWVRTIYREVLRNPKYPTFGVDSDRLIRNLDLVAERGAKCGVQLVVYNQEPFGMRADSSFWMEHPEMAGATWDHDFGVGDDHFQMRAMCVSSEPVRDYLRDSSAQLLKSVPGIAGIITISASEFMSHCYSHHGRTSVGPVPCPRCAEREASDVVVDVLNCMRDGMDRVNPAVPLIAWNWSWVFYEDDPQPSIISRLRPSIQIQGDFERGDWITDPYGCQVEINEYSLSYVGPSKRFRQVRELAQAQGRPVSAKLQIGTTHEIASVSNLPLITRLYGKTSAFKELGLAGFMGCWNFGTMLTLNTRAFNFFLSDACPDSETEALMALALAEFPGCDVAGVLEAWYGFGEAFDHYPFSIPFLYNSPINYSVALPMHPCSYASGQRIKRSWLMDPRDDNDEPSSSLGAFTAEQIAERLERMAELWRQALAVYELALADATGDAAREELSVARCIGVCVRSVSNYYRLHLLKRDWDDGMLPQFLEIVGDEIQVVEDALPAYEADDRQGFHIEAQGFMVTPELLRGKLQLLRTYLAQ